MKANRQHIVLYLLHIAMVCGVVLFATSCQEHEMTNNVLATNDYFTVTGDSVVDGDNIAVAVSATEILTNYSAIAQSDSLSEVRFRLAFNSHDNEMPAGMWHKAVAGIDTVHVAGEVADSVSSPVGYWRDGDVLHLRVDLSDMLDAFDNQGYWVTAHSDTLRAAEFNGVWVAGDCAPLSWNYEQLHLQNELKLQPSGTRGIYKADIKLHMGAAAVGQRKAWSITAPNLKWPQYSSGQPLIDALYNMSISAIDGFDWKVQPGNVSHDSFILGLSLACLDPVRAMQMLRDMVDGDEVRRSDTWPVGSSRLEWTLGAWQVYCLTGDRQWLKYCQRITKNTIDSEIQMLLDSRYGLVRGGDESIASHLPVWAEMRDVWDVMSLRGSESLACACYVLAEIDDELEEDDQGQYETIAERLKDNINQQLWNENRGYYSEYLYGTMSTFVSSGVDNRAQALAVLCDVADDDRAESLIESTPVSHYGVISWFPLRESRQFVSPITQAMWNIAAAHVGNENMLRRGLGAMYRAQALWGGCDVQCDPVSGRLAAGGRKIDMAAANVAMVYGVYAGMNFLPSGIEFNPVVPQCLKGNKTITDFKYRNSTLNITIIGSGNSVARTTIDGKEVEDSFFPATMNGRHNIEITLEEGSSASQHVTIVPSGSLMPATPVVRWSGKQPRVVNYSGLGYKLIVNGKSAYNVSDTTFAMPEIGDFSVMALQSINKYGRSYVSRPYRYIKDFQIVNLADFAMYSAENDIQTKTGVNKMVNLSELGNNTVVMAVDVNKAGGYALDARYANGAGWAIPMSKPTVVRVLVNTHEQGSLVLAKRGKGEWHNSDFSNMLHVDLLKGRNYLELQLNELADSSATIQYLRLMKL